ncbi:hypothetical protein PTKU64_90680 (plasmid) [Paraburkholderia terrae]|uniref:Uncharacterized protein n=1 Tax=Paraburkholderia terrae TaxID=311230 RepID=A0ABN6JWP8_9BURK|nr:hypothetical protein PTKU64_90680 [Paraburkholderia terrae]
MLKLTADLDSVAENIRHGIDTSPKLIVIEAIERGAAMTFSRWQALPVAAISRPARLAGTVSATPVDFGRCNRWRVERE